MEYLQVLVADDEPGMRLGVQRALSDAVISLPEVQTDVGFRVNIAESGEEALAMIAVQRPDILLLDHKMGGMSGLDVLDHIKAGPSQEQMLTIMITAYASLETAVTAIKQGAYDFLAKPFTPAELKATVRKAVESLVMGRQARKLAQEKRQVRFEFIRVLTHELKSPLAAVEGYLNIMQQRAAGDKLSDYDNVIERCILRLGGMRKLIFDLLDLTRIESGQKNRELTPVHLQEAARRAFEAVQLPAQKRNISLNLHAPDDLVFYSDAGEMDIIFNNLVSNAVKYNRDGGRVDVTLASAPDGVAITVADTGIGMTAQESARLFQDFVRIKNPHTRTILGSGLGLSIVKKLAQLYHGDITVTSEPEVGSTFVVTLKNHEPH